MPAMMPGKGSTFLYLLREATMPSYKGCRFRKSRRWRWGEMGGSRRENTEKQPDGAEEIHRRFRVLPESARQITGPQKTIPAGVR